MLSELALVPAARVVVVVANLTVPQSLTNLATSMLPIPVARSYPLPALYPAMKLFDPQFVLPAVHSTELLPWVMS